MRATGVQAIAALCPALRRLQLDHCSGVGPAGGRALRGLVELRHVSMDGCCPGVAAALEGTRAARQRRSHVAGRWWLTTGT